MMRWVTLSLLAVGTALLAAPVPKETTKQFKIEGTWKLVACDYNGKSVAVTANPYWTFDADLKLTTHAERRPKGNESSHTHLVIPAKADAKRIDLKNATEPTSHPGLFDFSPDGDKLRLCIDFATAPVRPEIVGPGPTIYLWTFERVK